MRIPPLGHAVLVAVAVAAALVIALPATSAAATSPSGCSLEPTGGTIERTIGERHYLLNVPAGLRGGAVPLVLSLHGGNQPLDLHVSETGWSEFAATHDFIVAYPEARRDRFPNWDYSHESADIAFLREVVAEISRTWCVRPRRVYAEGYSNGALLAERLACDAGDVFAAAAAYAGGFPGEPCRPERPIAVGIFQGILDPASVYPIGLQNRDRWLSINGCPSEPTTEPGVLVEAARYAPCDGGVEVVWRVYLQSHNWPYGADNADIRERIWSLFRRNPRPPSKLRLRARPRRAPAGERTSFRFRVSIGSGDAAQPVGGATVRFAGHAEKTNRRGMARIAASPRRPGIRRARAAKAGFRPNAVTIRIVSAR